MIKLTKSCFLLLVSQPQPNTNTCSQPLTHLGGLWDGDRKIEGVGEQKKNREKEWVGMGK